MPTRTVMLKNLADRLRKHHERLAQFYKTGTVAAHEDEWIAANNELEVAIARIEVFGDASHLEDALRAHAEAITKIMRKYEIARIDIRVEQLTRALA